MATKKFSPAQIAAQKLFAERARSGTLGKGMRKANPTAKMKIERSQTPDNPEGIVVTEAGALRFARQNMPSDLKKAGFVASVFPGARGWVINYSAKGGRKTNPDKAKPRAYVKRASQATGAPPSKRLVTRRKKALTAPAGYFPNPGSAMMTGYQVICMHPKKHVVGVFKTMAEAKQIATALANAKGVAYGVKAVKVHKAHFAA
jgi:hypothetical protein